MTGPAETNARAVDLLPVTYLEEEWVRAVDIRGSDHNLPLAINIEGPFDHGVLLDALRALTARHETLRMAFVPDQRRIRRAVWPMVEPSIYTADLASAPEDERERQLESMILAEARQLTDLTRAPLWRGFVVRMSPVHHVLVTVWHHVIFDGWSTRVAFRDLTSLYASQLRGERSRLPEPEIHIADYAGWERQLRLPDAAVAHWRSVLPGESAALPMEREADHGPQLIVGRKYPTIPGGQVSQLEEIARTLGVTLTSALRSVVLTALRPYLPEQPVIGCVHGNRERPELQPIIGLLSDHLPVRVDLSGSPSFLDLITRVHGALRTARRYQAPCGSIANAVPSLPPGEQMFDVSINNMRQSAPLVERVTAADGATVEFSVRDVEGTELWPRIRHPFSGGVRLGYQLRRTLSGQLSGEIWGHVPAFNTATIDALGRAFAETASKIVSNPRLDIKLYAPVAGRRRR
jgi:Condensation domain